MYPPTAQIPFENAQDVNRFFMEDGEKAHREEGLRRHMKIHLLGILDLRVFIRQQFDFVMAKHYQSHSILGSKM